MLLSGTSYLQQSCQMYPAASKNHHLLGISWHFEYNSPGLAANFDNSTVYFKTFWQPSLTGYNLLWGKLEILLSLEPVMVYTLKKMIKHLKF